MVPDWPRCIAGSGRRRITITHRLGRVAHILSIHAPAVVQIEQRLEAGTRLHKRVDRCDCPYAGDTTKHRSARCRGWKGSTEC